MKQQGTLTEAEEEAAKKYASPTVQLVLMALYRIDQGRLEVPVHGPTEPCVH